MMNEFCSKVARVVFFFGGGGREWEGIGTDLPLDPPLQSIKT